MSFSIEIKKEISEIKNKKSCCRTSFLLGMIIDGTIIDEKSIIIKISSADVLDMILNTLHFSKINVDVTREKNLGLETYTARLESERFVSLLSRIDDCSYESSLFENEKCMDGNCKKCFLRGVFIASGTVNEPQKGYHMEFRFKNATRAAFVYKQLSEEGMEAKIVNRSAGSTVGLYYKNSTAIEDVLTYIGAVKSVFDLINVKIEREIRNSVNRGTNCVAGNIAKSVNAAQKQVSMIMSLEESGKLSMLPDELFETARLRLENPSASLSELALRHDPPISKSGLTHRLAKIMELAENVKKEGKA